MDMPQMRVGYVVYKHRLSDWSRYKHSTHPIEVWKKGFVANTKSSYSPSGVVYEDKLYVFHQGGRGDNRLRCNVSSYEKVGERYKPVSNATLKPPTIRCGLQ